MLCSCHHALLSEIPYTSQPAWFGCSETSQAPVPLDPQRLDHRPPWRGQHPLCQPEGTVSAV
jgi:hypothetical protein